MFDPGDAALGYADEALALATAPGIKKSLVADVHTLHARVLLSHGNVRGGYAELKKALAEQGGLTLQVNAAAIATRSDLATAALLNHDDESARRYLAYTGAGHGTPFGSAAVMAPPPCDDTLKPEDSAIVEFGIGADGAVAYATPVYASRLGPSAVEFARAVDGWSWTPAAVARIAPLFRAVTRVEVRCSTASARPRVINTLYGELDGWLKSRGSGSFTRSASGAMQARVRVADGPAITVAGDRSLTSDLAGLRAAMVRARASHDEAAAIPLLVILGEDAAVPAAERRAAIDEARAIAVRTASPTGVTTLLAIIASQLTPDGRGQAATWRGGLRTLLATPAVAADPRSRSVVRLLLADAYYHAPSPPDADALLRAVADDPALPAQDQLRSGANVRLASLLARSGDLSAARAAFDRSGISAQQCSLVDAQPIATRLGGSSTDFPRDALRWGFEGWVRLEFDVAADGHLVGQRAIVTYPPAVFAPAAIDTSKNWRYRPTFRPEGGTGCGGAQQTMRFTIN